MDEIRKEQLYLKVKSDALKASIAILAAFMVLATFLQVQSLAINGFFLISGIISSIIVLQVYEVWPKEDV